MKLFKDKMPLNLKKSLKDYFSDKKENNVHLALVDIVNINVLSISPIIWFPINGLKKLFVKDLKKQVHFSKIKTICEKDQILNEKNYL